MADTEKRKMKDPAVEFMINNLNQLLRDNRDLIAEIKEEVDSLIAELKSWHPFLSEANSSRSHSEILKHFVKELSTAVNEAEISIDKFVIGETLHPNKGIKRILGLPHAGKARKCSAEIRSLGDRLKEIRREAYGLSMSLQYEDSKYTAHDLRKAPLVEEDEVVGFEGEAGEIITNHLLGGSADLEFISIVGMPGLGKTTLANKIFKDSRVGNEFSIRIWVYVSQSYTQRDLFLDIINQFTRNTEDHQSPTTEDLVEVVRKHLLPGKYLIVLDDIWTPKALNDVKIALPNNLKGSRVLLTTRDSSLANDCCNNFRHQLKFLRDDECWMLLQKKVFHRDKCPPDLGEVGMNIAKKCMGLPLATLVIAGTLTGRGKTKSEWERVHQGMTERIIGSDILMTKKLVQMSYDSLRFNLKVCFLYCGAFPRGFNIPAWKLVRLWIAEGFIEDPKTRETPAEEPKPLETPAEEPKTQPKTLETPAEEPKTLETLAEEYLNELVSKNLLMVTRRTSNGQIKTCRMHDMLHEFCTLEASEENLFKEIKLGVEQSFPRNQELATFRRLCIDSSVKEFISKKPYGDSIRSFLCFSSQTIEMPSDELGTIPKSFPLLRVFDIEPILFPVFHKQFSQLYHLRYIALSSGLLEILPKFMGDLWNLQTLIILTQKTLDIQADICNMPRLRHLHTNASTKLRPSSAAIKTNSDVLQTLSTVEPESFTEHVFARCQKLKKLGIRGKIAELGGPILNINKLEYLEKLKLMNENLAGVKLHLQKGNIFPRSLKQVTLSGTRLDWKEMGRLGQLKALEVLKLKQNAFTGDTWESKDYVFTCLKVLWIEKSDLVSWKASNQHFPSLKRLVLRHLDKLEEVPIELASISNLQMMELENTTRTTVESARRIESRSVCTGFKLSISPPISDCN